MGDFAELASSQCLRFSRKAATLRIREAKSPSSQLLNERPILGFQILDDVLLLAAGPSDQDKQQELNRELHDLNASSVSASKIGARRGRRRTINYSISERFCVGGVLAQYDVENPQRIPGMTL